MKTKETELRSYRFKLGDIERFNQLTQGRGIQQSEMFTLLLDGFERHQSSTEQFQDEMKKMLNIIKKIVSTTNENQLVQMELLNTETFLSGQKELLPMSKEKSLLMIVAQEEVRKNNRRNITQSYDDKLKRGNQE